MKFVKELLAGRLGWLFTFANAALLVWGAYEKGIGTVRYFHFYHEPWAIQLFVLLNIPAILISGVISSLVTTYSSPPNSYYVQIDNFLFFSMVICACLQWLMLGWLLSRSNRARKATVDQ